MVCFFFFANLRGSFRAQFERYSCGECESVKKIFRPRENTSMICQAAIKTKITQTLTIL